MPPQEKLLQLSAFTFVPTLYESSDANKPEYSCLPSGMAKYFYAGLPSFQV